MTPKVRGKSQWIKTHQVERRRACWRVSRIRSCVYIEDVDLVRAVVVIGGPDVPVPVGLHIEEAAVVGLNALIIRAEVGTDL